MREDRNNRFTVVVRERNFANGVSLEELKGWKGKTIRAEGTVSIYRDTPQIEMSVPSQMVAR